MAAKYKTSLSVGEDIRETLLGDADVTVLTQKVIPVATDEALLPYIVYRRSGLEEKPVKNRGIGSDVVSVEISCLAATYPESIALAEAARNALEHSALFRSCVMADSEEIFEADAYIQIMTFRILT